MRMVQEERHVVSTGAVESADFAIKANGKAFKILIDKLYSDKPRAIVRELMTNAYDAHLMVGKSDVPFHITMPNIFDPTFAIRDFGPSMSHAQIMTLYRTVFDSTKDQDNHTVGKFGLGSKSPFAYTDVFSVQAFQGGFVRSYSAHIEGNGIPKINFLGEDSTTEPDGLLVTFPVKPNDINAFVEAFQRVCIGFDVMPMVAGIKQDRIMAYPAVASPSPTFWRLFDKNAYNTSAIYLPESGYPIVRQGCVCYPIDVTQINANDVEAAFLGQPLMIDMPIGSVEVSPSRESLSYDAQTIANLKAAIAKAATEFVASTQAMVDSFGSWIDAVRWFSKFILDLPTGHKTMLQKLVKYRGQTALRDAITLTDYAPTIYQSNKTYEQGGIQYGLFTRDTIIGYSYSRRRPVIDITTGTHRYFFHDKVTVVLEDPTKIKKSGPKRIRNAVERGVITAPIVWVRSFPNSMALKRLLVVLGRPKVMTMDDLPAPTNVDGTPAVRTKVQCRVYRPGADIKNCEQITVNTDDTHYFIRAERNYFTDAQGTVVDDYKVRMVVEKLRDMGQITGDVIIVPKSLNRLVNRAEDWVDVLVLACEVAASNFDEAVMNRALLVDRMDNLFGFRSEFVAKQGANAFKFGGAAFTVSTVVNDIKNELDAAKDTLAYIKLGNMMGVAGYERLVAYPPNVEVEVSQMEEALKVYPLLDTLSSIHSSKYVQAFVQYINLVDASLVNDGTNAVINDDANTPVDAGTNNA